MIKNLFGTKIESFSKNCLLLPFIPKGLLAHFEIKKLNSGKLFHSYTTDNLSIVKTGIGASFIGDAIYYLKDSPIENFFFLGACGAVSESNTLNIGSLVLPKISYANESFSAISTNGLSWDNPFKPDPSLVESIQELSTPKLTEVTCTALGTLALQNTLHNDLIKKEIDVVEMETAALFASAQKTKRRALALLFVTDILKTKPIFTSFQDADKNRITESLDLAYTLIENIILKLK